MVIQGTVLQSTSWTFDWTLRGLKELFDTGFHGEDELKTVTSPLFDGGKWRIRFKIPKKKGSCEIYLQAVPTQEEIQAGGDNWERAGRHSAWFALRSLDTESTYKQTNRSNAKAISAAAVVIGFDDVWKRSSALASAACIVDDGMVVTCHLKKHAYKPSLPSKREMAVVPRSLIDGLSALVDDPGAADVVFNIKPDAPPKAGKRWRERRVYASKTLLMARSEYFTEMFKSDFQEAGAQGQPALALAVAVGTGGHEEAEDIMDEDGWNESDLEDDDDDEVKPAASTSSSSRELRNTRKRTADTDAPAGPSSSSKRQKQREVTADTDEDTTSKRRTEVVITDISHRTMKALVRFLYTDDIAFLSLSRGFGISDDIETEEGKGKASPKAIYAAADKMGLEDLKKRAFEAIKRSLTPENISHQIFGTFTFQHAEIKEMEMAFAKKNWAKIHTTASFQQVLTMPASYPGFASILPELLK